MRPVENASRLMSLRALLIAAFFGLTVPTGDAKAQNGTRVFALLAIDTDSNAAGVADDGRSLGGALAGGFGNSNRLNLRILTGAEVNPDAIINYFRNVPSGPDDVLLFYYSGHGGTFEDKGHVLTTSHGFLPRGTIRAQITARQPRLSVILTDCCASLIKQGPAMPGAGAPAPPRREVSPILRCLLLEHRGVVDVASSSFGEVSWGQKGTGGLFTRALANAVGMWDTQRLDSNRDGFVTWTELFEQVRQDTQIAYRTFKQGVLSQDIRSIDRGLLEELQKQRDQVPQAFGLGDPAPTIAQREFHAPNVGIYFRLVPVGTAAGAQLTRNPDVGSGAAQIGLEPGDTIYNLDGLPIRHAVDVMNHHARTEVSFINVRTGRAQAGVMILPPYTPLPPDVPPENFAANLGIHHQLIPLDGDTFGARLSRTAFGNVPGAVIGLELGDMIVRLDGQPIKKPEDVLAHFDQTTVEFINIRTGKLESRVVQLPGQGSP